ncbi:MAG TPA: PAS domain-containing protein [Rhizomicrobium sp.]|jgi:hypothetical protein|nr:PAS domain-containing protein [Rhizomicrobium sp.]
MSHAALQHDDEAAGHFNALAIANGWYARCDGSLSFDTPALHGLAALWREKAAGALPKRNDFGPREMRGAMAQMALFDAIDGGKRFYIRLLGTALSEIYGNITGRHIDEHFSPAVTEIWHAALNETLNARRPLRYKGRVSYEQRNFFAVESIQAPLSETGSAADRILMVMYRLPGAILPA